MNDLSLCSCFRLSHVCTMTFKGNKEMVFCYWRNVKMKRRVTRLSSIQLQNLIVLVKKSHQNVKYSKRPAYIIRHLNFSRSTSTYCSIFKQCNLFLGYAFISCLTLFFLAQHYLMKSNRWYFFYWFKNAMLLMKALDLAC